MPNPDLFTVGYRSAVRVDRAEVAETMKAADAKYPPSTPSSRAAAGFLTDLRAHEGPDGVYGEHQIMLASSLHEQGSETLEHVPGVVIVVREAEHEGGRAVEIMMPMESWAQLVNDWMRLEAGMPREIVGG